MKNALIFLIALLLTPLSAMSAGKPPRTLWPQGAPGALGASPKDIPTLTPYLATKANGAAMLLIPGGSYSGIYPCFIWHTCEDKLVPVEHTQLYAAALHKNGVPHELHLYQQGDHGTGLIGTDHPWFRDLIFWLRAQKFIP